MRLDIDHHYLVPLTAILSKEREDSGRHSAMYRPALQTLPGGKRLLGPTMEMAALQHGDLVDGKGLFIGDTGFDLHAKFSLLTR